MNNTTKKMIKKIPADQKKLADKILNKIVINYGHAIEKLAKT